MLRAIWILALVALMLPSWAQKNHWYSAKGHEFEDVAQNLVDGHGFSFATPERWLFDRAGPSAYSPTAWKEPVYPAILAAGFAVLGPWARPGLVALQSLCLLFTALTLYLLGDELSDWWTGMLAGVALLTVHQVQAAAHDTLANTALAGLLVTLSAWSILRTMKHPTPWRGALTGAALGATVLTHAATLLFFPVAAYAIISSRAAPKIRWRTTAAALLVGAAIVAPWTLRNFVTFNALIPVRTGLGQIVHFGNPILAETFLPGFRACPEDLGDPPQVANVTQALALVRTPSGRERRALLHRQFRCIDGAPPPGYSAMNEAQRDAVYRHRAMAFIGDHPGVFGQLAVIKAIHFIMWGGAATVIAALAAAGGWIGRRDRRVRVVLLLFLTFLVPHVLGVTFFYRYRYPIEPLLIVLASFAVMTAAGYTYASLREVGAGGPYKTATSRVRRRR